MCDAISDAILDAYLAKDPKSRVACETSTTTGQVHVFGEITSKAKPDITAIVRKTIKSIGYTSSDVGFDGDSCAVLLSIGHQSHDIATGVNEAIEARGSKVHDRLEAQGAGDQGIMFGYATDETPSMMPMPIHLAHLIAKQLEATRKSKVLPYLRPDGKTQVTIGYIGNVPFTVDTVVVSTQHDEDIDQETLRRDIIDCVINPILANSGLHYDTTAYIINPSGRFVIGGPMGDAGLTGRKIIVDTYGGMARHGGGAFSGKDPSKVDRSAAYAMRWVAKNVVGAGLASRCEVQVAYAIGKANPVGLYLDTYGTAAVDEDRIIKAIKKAFDLRPLAIIEALDLQRPIYKQVAAYGHFGRDDLDLPWERLDKVKDLLQIVRRTR